MKWLKDNWFILLVFAAAAFFFWEWQCNPPKIKTVAVPVEDTAKTKEFERQADSLKSHVGVQMTSINQLSDSLVNLKKTVRALMARIREDKTFINLPDSGLVTMDSDGYRFLVSRCDSLGNSFNDYILLSEAKESGQDSVISSQNSLISTKDSLIIEKQKFNDMLMASFKTTRDGFSDIQKQYERKIQWHKTKQTILVAIIIAEAAKIVYDASHK